MHHQAKFSEVLEIESKTSSMLGKPLPIELHPLPLVWSLTKFILAYQKLSPQLPLELSECGICTERGKSMLEKADGAHLMPLSGKDKYSPGKGSKIFLLQFPVASYGGFV